MRLKKNRLNKNEAVFSYREVTWIELAKKSNDVCEVSNLHQVCTGTTAQALLFWEEAYAFQQTHVGQNNDDE